MGLPFHNRTARSAAEPGDRQVPWNEQGAEPDYRFSLANERTFLAWVRTALAILAGAIVLDQVGLQHVSGWVGPVLAATLSLLAGALGLGAYGRWRANQIAMRHARSLPKSSLIPTVALTVAVLGAGLTAAVMLR
jgi:putative membrane protein